MDSCDISDIYQPKHTNISLKLHSLPENNNQTNFSHYIFFIGKLSHGFHQFHSCNLSKYLGLCQTITNLTFFYEHGALKHDKVRVIKKKYLFSGRHALLTLLNFHYQYTVDSGLKP